MANPRLVVVRDQFALRGLSDEALKRIAPMLREAQRQILDEIEKAMERTGDTDRLAWFVRRRIDTYATIQAQLEAVAVRLDELLGNWRLEAFQHGLENAREYLESVGALPEGVPPGGERTPAGALGRGDRIEAILDPTLPPGDAGAYEQLATRTQDAPRPYKAPTITAEQLRAVAEGRGFDAFPGLTKRSPGPGQGADYTLDSATYRWAGAQLDRIRTQLEIGFATGRSNGEILADVRDYFDGASRAQMEAIVRTSMAEASQAAHDAFYEANAAVLGDAEDNRYIWDASNDGRLCPKCAPLDGQKFKKRQDAPPCPLHFQCRCVLLPLTPLSYLRDELPGSFLESVPVEYEKGKNGKKTRKDPPDGYTGDNAYRQPRKINGEWRWVRRRELPAGHTTAGDMLQRGSDQLAHDVLGNWDRVKDFRRRTGPGGENQKDPQQAVIELLRPGGAP